MSSRVRVGRVSGYAAGGRVAPGFAVDPRPLAGLLRDEMNEALGRRGLVIDALVLRLLLLVRLARVLRLAAAPPAEVLQTLAFGLASKRCNSFNVPCLPGNALLMQPNAFIS